MGDMINRRHYCLYRRGDYSIHFCALICALHKIQRELHLSVIYFLPVNLVAVAQSWLVSVGLALYALLIPASRNMFTKSLMQPGL